MHYCVMLFTKEFPTDDVIKKILAPYNDDTVYELPENERPDMSWDYWTIGGRYGGGLKLKIDEENKKHEWPYISREPKTGRLFRSDLLETLLKEMAPRRGNFAFYEGAYLLALGYDDGYIRVDGCAVSDCINLDENGCYYCIDADGNLHARETRQNGKWVENDKFDEIFAEIIKNSQDCYVCKIDIHD